MNKDSYNDIITALAGTLNSPLQIQLGSQTGEFTDASNLLPNLDATVLTKLKIADVNNDACPDIILTSIGRLNYEGDKILAEFSPRNYVLLNSGNGAFLDGTAALFGEGFASTRAIDIQVRDFGVDGLNDVLLINPDGNLLYIWSAETSTMQSADALSFSNVPPSSVNNQSIQLDANGDGIVDTVSLQDGVPSIIYDSATLQKSGNSLTPEPLNSVTSYVSPYQYKITGPSGLTIATVNQIGDVVYLEFSSRVPAYVWGNVLMTFDPAKLQCVSIEENPNNLYGFWVWWAVATGMPYYGGGGTYYYYDDTGLGSGWAKAWAHTEPGAGPTGTYDNTTGKIRLYTDTSSGYSYTSPLRIGFRVLQAGNADFTVQSNDYMSYDWNNVDAGTTSTVNIMESGQSVYKEDVANNVRISISGPAMVEIGQTYTIDTWGEIITPFRPIGTNVYSWELYIDGALYQRRGFTYGEEHRRSWEFTGTTEGAIVYKFRFRDGSRVHGGYGWVEVEMTVNVAPPGPHIDSITPTSALPTEEITITGRNFDAYLASNNIVNFKGSDVSIAATHVTPDGTILAVHVPADKESGDCMVSVTTNKGTSNEVPFTVQSAQDGITRIISQLEEKIASGIYTKNAVNKMKEALKVIKEIQTLAGQQPPDTSAILDKIKNAMNFIIDGAGAGAGIWDKLYILTGIRAMITDSMIIVEQTWMMIDRLKTLTPNDSAWTDMKTALLGTNNVVEKYYKQGISKAIEAMNDNIVVPLTTAGTKGVETQSIILSLVQSTILYPQSLQGTLTGTLGADNEIVQTIATAVTQANGQMANNDYAGALQAVLGVWNHLEPKKALPNAGCYCVAVIEDYLGGRRMEAKVKYELYYDNDSGWKLKFSVRDGRDDTLEIQDIDQAQARCIGQKIRWSAQEKQVECNSVKGIDVTDNVIVVNNGWIFKPDQNPGKLENNVNSTVDYVLPVFDNVFVNTDRIEISIIDGRGNITDKCEASVKITIRKPMTPCYIEPDDPFLTQPFDYEYADEFSRYRVKIDVTETSGADEMVQEVMGCGCEIKPAWEAAEQIDGKGSPVVPEYFAVNVPQTFTFSGYADNSDKLIVNCQGGQFKCESMPAEDAVTDAVRYSWQVTKGAGIFEYGASSSETAFTATLPSDEEKGTKFEAGIGNTGMQAEEAIANSKEIKSTAVLVDVVVDAVTEYDELYKGAVVRINDNDTDLDEIKDIDDDKVDAEQDLAQVDIFIAPLIDGSNVILEKQDKGYTRLWETPDKITPLPLEILGQKMTVNKGQIIGKLNNGGKYILPAVLYVEGIKVSENAKETELKLTYIIKDNVKFSDRAKVSVIKADIIVDGILEEEEETLGAYAKYNNDDDDRDDVMDRDDVGVTNDNVLGDDDLELYTLFYGPRVPGGVVRLEIVANEPPAPGPAPVIAAAAVPVINVLDVNNCTIKVWADYAKTKLLLPTPNNELFKEWVFCRDKEIPQEVYIEGYKLSAKALDTVLNLTYCVKADDKIMNTVELIDIDIDSDNDNGSNEPEEDNEEEFIEEESFGKFYSVNEDDDDNDGIPDNQDDIINGDTDKEDMITVVIQAYLPNDIPVAKRKFALSVIGEGKRRVFWQVNSDVSVLLGPDDKESQNLWDYVSHGQKMVLLVESVKEGMCQLKFIHHTPENVDTVNDTNTLIDLDIDSDNDNGFDEPERDKDTKAPIEGVIEDGLGLPGKCLTSNLGDTDGDKKPDFADWEIVAGPNQNIETYKFVPIVLEIAKNVKLATDEIVFTYDAFAPQANPPYPLPDKNLRIWKKPAHEPRTNADYIASDTTYSPAKLGFTDEKRVVTLYVEGLVPSTALGGQLISVTLKIQDVEGQHGDAVKTTVVNIDMDIDSDNDNYHKSPDKSQEEEYVEDIAPGKIFIVNNSNNDGDSNTLDYEDDTTERSDATGDMVILVLHKIGLDIPDDSAEYREFKISKSGDGKVRLFAMKNQKWSCILKPDEKSTVISWGNIVNEDLEIYVEGAGDGEFEFNFMQVKTGLKDTVKGSIGLIDVIGYQPGTKANPGAIVSDLAEDKELNLVFLVNDDNDDAGPAGKTDNDDAVIGANDNDIVQLTLIYKFPKSVKQGDLFINTGNAVNIRIFNPDGISVLAKKDELIHVANPAGTLAGLVTNGTITIWFEGLQYDKENNISLSYWPSDAYGSTSIGNDRLKFTTAQVVVHPVETDFAENKAGRIMISTYHDDNYYTAVKTTKLNEVAQKSDAIITVTAYLQPNTLADQVLYFRVTDPDDLSPYEPDTLGNDNRDPDTDPKHIVLNKDNDKAELKKINNNDVLAAEVELAFTAQYAGDNYQIEVSFDKDFKSICAKSIPFVAWKRMYLEIDKMYKKGATVTEKFNKDGNNNDDVITVDNTEDFAVGQKIIFFDKSKDPIETEIRGKTGTTITVPDLQIDLEKYSGVKLKDDNSVFDVSLSLLPKAYGDKTDGTDGGTFVEFVTEFPNSGSESIPRYHILNDTIGLDFAKHWFDHNQVVNRNNLFQLVFADVSNIWLSQPQDRANTGISWEGPNIAIVFSYVFDNNGQIEKLSAEHQEEFKSELVVHEIGHQFGLFRTVPNLAHVDTSSNVSNHDNSDKCIMSYDNDYGNKFAEFDVQCIYVIRSSSEPR